MPLFVRHARTRLVAFSLALLTGACAPEADDAPPEEGGAAAATESGPAELIPGTPAGGLVDWIADIREGTTGIEVLAAEDATGAQRRALDLYVGRQEYLELYYGTNGRISSGVAVELGEAVMENEARFHEMLQLLAVTPVDTAAVRVKREELHAQMDRVLERAQTVNIPLTPPGNPAAAARE
jgi:hypothetical protein